MTTPLNHYGIGMDDGERIYLHISQEEILSENYYQAH